jgi:putative aldouronate transport system substrate-binding protein
MKGKMKGLALSLVVVLMSMLALAGCTSGGGSTDVQSTNTPSNKPTEAVKEELKPYHLTMFIPGSGDPKDMALVNKELSTYLTEKINATLTLQVIDWGSWADKMNLKYASGEKFDLVWTVNWDNFYPKIEQGNFLDLTKLIDEYAPDAKKIIDPALMSGSKYKGKHYSLPVQKEMASTRGLLLRKDLVEKYKVDLTKITKLEDMEPIYDQILKNEPGVVPFFLDKATSVFTILSQKDLDSYLVREAKDYKVVNMFETPQYKAGLDLARKWYLAGYVNKDAATTGNWAEQIKAGKVFSFPSALKPGKDAEVSQAHGVEYVQVDLTKPIITTADTTGSMMSISRTSGNPERAMMFLNLLYTDKKLVNMIAYGIEGTHFVKKSENVIDFPQGVTAQTSGYSLGTAWMFGNQFNNYLWTNEDPKKWEKFGAFNKAADVSRVIGFSFDPSNVKNEVSAESNVHKEFIPALQTGTVDPNEVLPQFNSKLKSIGTDKIAAEKQKQIDAFVKENGLK